MAEDGTGVEAEPNKSVSNLNPYFSGSLSANCLRRRYGSNDFLVCSFFFLFFKD